jgi:cephalosporin hydroxylase
MKHNEITEALAVAEQAGPTLDLDFLTGFSGGKLLGALQRIATGLKPNEAYCEIGVYQGLSLVSVAASNPSVECIGIDNFAFFDPQGTNKAIIEERIKLAGCRNVRLVEADYEDSVEGLQSILGERQIGLLFVDGPHDYRSQLMCLLLFKPFFSEQAVVVVDDCNYAHVRQANRDFLVTNPEYKLVFEQYTAKHPNNMTPLELSEARRGWWNGVNILARDLSNNLPQQLPITDRSRQLYENEHLLHSMRYADVAPDALRFACALKPLRLRLALQRLRTLLRKMDHSDSSRLPFEELNMRKLQ